MRNIRSKRNASVSVNSRVLVTHVDIVYYSRPLYYYIDLSDMPAGFVLTSFSIAGLLLGFVYWYAYRPFRYAVYLIPVHVGLTLSCLSIFVLLPVDLARSMQVVCDKIGKNGPDSLESIVFYSLACNIPSFLPEIPKLWLLWMWRLFYWYTFLSTWILLPFLTSYVTSGQWNARARARNALWDNVIFYGIYSVVGIGFVLIYFWNQRDPNFSFLEWLMAFGYAFGLFLAVSFLGHGLIDLPRRCYRNSIGRLVYQDTFLHVSKLKDRIDDLDAKMAQLHQRVLVICSILNAPPDNTVQDNSDQSCKRYALQLEEEIERDRKAAHRSYHNRLGNLSKPVARARSNSVSAPEQASLHLNQDSDPFTISIVQNNPTLFKQRSLSQEHQPEARDELIQHAIDKNHSYLDLESADILSMTSLPYSTHNILYIMAELVHLRQQWIECQRCFIRQDGEWSYLVKHGCQLLDDEYDQLEGIMKRSRRYRLILTRLSWSILSMVFGIMSMIVIWSEIAIIFQATPIASLNDVYGLSKFGVATLSSWIGTWIRSGQLSSAMLISMILLIYMTICIFVSLTKFTLFQGCRLVPRHHTDLPSLLLLTSYSCRFIFSLCYHYLGLVDTCPPYHDHDPVSSALDDSSFSRYTCFVNIMGSINLVPFLGIHYYLFISLFVVSVCIIVLFRLDIRLVSWFGLDPLFESFISGSLDTINDDIERGKRLVRQCRPLIHHHQTRERQHQYGIGRYRSFIPWTE
jgi:hypothetical protein